ncbi:MAG: NADH-dependent [FeFe] hydrogenase, group A6 [Clostridia bacterium]|nr:NADH-dependent [FeFe] hydrogenase, group A6 [Clostridia bacterium]MDD4047877.1 NADH-dependent [FeFe] hydrogenase, group A6 [Clostridia bacterium]
MNDAVNINKNITVTIDGIQTIVPEGTTILEAAKKLGIKIPTLCHHSDLKPGATCRVCSVEVKGQRRLKTSCNTPVADGDEITTNSKAVREARKTIIELILADHPQDCLKCVRNGNCELQKLAYEYQIREVPFERTVKDLPIEDSNPSIVRDMNKCIKCGRCVEVCQEVQQVAAINTSFRSGEFKISTAFNESLADSPCVYCGQCITVCPVGAITEKDDTDRVWEALDNPDIHVVVQTAPAVRVAIGEEFDMQAGSIGTGKMVAALKRLGFDKVFDTNFTADLTILEEGNELLQRITEGGVLPMMTSCSPGWINYIEKFYPELLPHVSSCKSPQQMFGAVAKTYYAEKAGISPDKIFVVSIMPCTAKKYECTRPEMRSSGYQDVDVVLTTRELARMIKQAGLDMGALHDEEYDDPLGTSTGAAVIFGATGGVMEAALRTVYEVVTGQKLENVDLKMVRGLKGIKEAEVDLAGTKVKIAIASSLKNAKEILEKIKAGECDYHFIEIMACPGGCLSGGGQPFGTTNAIREKRLEGLYNIDSSLKLRKSHENPAVNKLYEEFLEKPLGHKSHELLHTHYVGRKY